MPRFISEAPRRSIARLLPGKTSATATEKPLPCSTATGPNHINHLMCSRSARLASANVKCVTGRAKRGAELAVWVFIGNELGRPARVTPANVCYVVNCRPKPDMRRLPRWATAAVSRCSEPAVLLDHLVGGDQDIAQAAPRTEFCQRAETGPGSLVHRASSAGVQLARQHVSLRQCDGLAELRGGTVG